MKTYLLVLVKVDFCIRLYSRITSY